jgi:hypothetical protein
MRLSDARLRCRETDLIYPDHLPSPWLTEDAARDRSNRLLDVGRRNGDISNVFCRVKYACVDAS